MLLLLHLSCWFNFIFESYKYIHFINIWKHYSLFASCCSTEFIDQIYQEAFVSIVDKTKMSTNRDSFTFFHIRMPFYLGLAWFLQIELLVLYNLTCHLFILIPFGKTFNFSLLKMNFAHFISMLFHIYWVSCITTFVQHR